MRQNFWIIFIATFITFPLHSTSSTFDVVDSFKERFMRVLSSSPSEKDTANIEGDFNRSIKSLTHAEKESLFLQFSSNIYVVTDGIQSMERRTTFRGPETPEYYQLKKFLLDAKKLDQDLNTALRSMRSLPFSLEKLVELTSLQRALYKNVTEHTRFVESIIVRTSGVDLTSFEESAFRSLHLREVHDGASYGAGITMGMIEMSVLTQFNAPPVLKRQISCESAISFTYDDHLNKTASIVSVIAPLARIKTYNYENRILSHMLLPPRQTFMTFNLSLGAIKGEEYWCCVPSILELMGRLDCLLVTAAGNERSSYSIADSGSGLYAEQLASFKPTSLVNTILVANIDPVSNLLVDSSNYPGTSKIMQRYFIAAPGTNYIVGTQHGYEISTKKGTSFSSPHVAGAIVLMQEINPALTLAEAKRILFSSADRTFFVKALARSYWVCQNASIVEEKQLLGFSSVLFENVAHKYGHGILNIERALKMTRDYMPS
jgi:hypothetical protein